MYYLTIQETQVKPGKTQRRPGLHVDRPGEVKIKNTEMMMMEDRKGKGKAHKYQGHRWGAGSCHMFNKNMKNMEDYYDNYMEKLYVTFGGIYMASSVDDSCRVWNCSVGEEGVGRLGDIEHLRHVMPGAGTKLRSHQIYWITDSTPHESLPVKTKTMRQFFRIVTSEVSLWYENHSTPSPKGVLPDPRITKIVRGDKFSEEGVEIVTDHEETGVDQMKSELDKLKLRNKLR